MRLKNKTDIPDEKIQEIINFVRPKMIGQVRFDLGNRSTAHFSGTAWRSGLIYAKINTKAKYPFYHNITVTEIRSVANGVDENGNLIFHEKVVRRNGGYLPSLILSVDEALVHIFAHELRHIWQNRHKGKRRTGRVWGARGKFSERDADAYAIRMQRKWRKLHNKQEDYSNVQFLDTPAV